ncbi:MAG: hypothetical protein KGZ97_11655 [Bacteroidetes bacterium]|nr:hypothetical protein [Bacteroidota bacterium]
MKNRIKKNLAILIIGIIGLFIVADNISAEVPNLEPDVVKCTCSIIPWNYKCTTKGWTSGRCNDYGDPDCASYDSNCGLRN